ncbi:APC family permease [Burkholderia thailandensis]|uniref:Amino acid permease family protein n=2 Tax=Burkholderia thailandensis TaxID=57975 RepID=A0AAW9CQY2_BURTH|nr:APC family permease [Burkholderia thailandensis]ABC35258.1 amino acid transporter, putative [Burkholderia thailandensis E264]AHI66468.1 amino acid permease family protein [Burkholderia thailandensis H0587]AHI75489.1 amino acid permease family protein [Burkholderia thailandensis 2002721723]AHI82154.1 amino acid permease family protein [Burkholderia thailandensis E444]AIC90143.1 amino acid permease family protein [Burkholderia thailandensis USAMRU Malaysia \
MSQAGLRARSTSEIEATISHEERGHTLHRGLSWKDAFWVTSGVPAGVLFTIGGVCATIGQPAWAVWIAAITMGLIQSATYAEISGLFPHKSGGASVYGAIGWVRYGKLIAPVSVWCNWLAWSPMLALGCGLAASYALTSLFPADAAILHWQWTLADLGFIKPGLTLRVNATFVIATILLLITFKLQHSGASKAARTQRILGIASLTPLLIVGIVPFVTGDVPMSNLLPLLPLGHDAQGNLTAATFGNWNGQGVVMALGAMFMAGWASYGFETAVCYTREFRDPRRDTAKAIFWSGALCLVVMTLVPMAFQGALGTAAMLDPRIGDGTGVAAAMAKIVGGGAWVANAIVVMLMLSILLIVMTSMMGSSRTLYQASVDGWLPKYLSHVNEHGSPTRAMWTDLGFNLVLLLMSDYMTVLSISNVCYMLFVFLNLQSGWIHRMDRGQWQRPFRCPTWLLVLGSICGYANLVYVGAGADLQGAGTLRNGLIAMLLIVPVFVYRHYWQDRGRFPAQMRSDMELVVPARSVWLNMAPYAALAAAALTIAVSYYLAWMR